MRYGLRKDHSPPVIRTGKETGEATSRILRIAFGFLWLTVASIAAAKQPANYAEPIFWQADSPQASVGDTKRTRLYLLGSIHVGPKEGWQLPAKTLARFRGADALVVEVDMTEGSPEEQDDAVMQFGLLSPGESLKNHISPAVYGMLERHLNKTDRSPSNVNAWKPWMVATMLLSFELQRLGYPTEAGLDLDLMRKVSKNQRVIGLESMAEQLALLGGLSAKNQELMLRDMLLQMNDIEAYFNELKEAWRTGNEKGLTEVLFRELAATPELGPFYEKIIYGRNETMCRKFIELSENGGTLFGVVGASHLVGSRGIPACLKRHGFTVTRLRDGR